MNEYVLCQCMTTIEFVIGVGVIFIEKSKNIYYVSYDSIT